MPKQFRNMRVERGGIGAGTVITFEMKVLGRTTRFRAEVTTFIVEPGSRPDEAAVTISTEMTARPDLSGAIERFLSERVLRPMYAEELRLLEAAAADPHGTAASASSPG